MHGAKQNRALRLSLVCLFSLCTKKIRCCSVYLMPHKHKRIRMSITQVLTLINYHCAKKTPWSKINSINIKKTNYARPLQRRRRGYNCHQQCNRTRVFALYATQECLRCNKLFIFSSYNLIKHTNTCMSVLAVTYHFYVVLMQPHCSVYVVVTTPSFNCYTTLYEVNTLNCISDLI